MNIEELAFKDRKILANLNAVDLLNIIEFLQDDRRQCLEELSKTHNRSVEIQKENQELKSQLAGTTHCFDEEEHNKLKEEITNLSKEIDMWNSKYNDMFDENRMLKEALETKSYCKYANKCDELNDCSREEYEDMSNANVRLNVENYDLQEENQALKKQLEECQLQNFDLREDIMIQKQAIPNKLIKDKTFYDLYDMPTYEDLLTRQKEFIKYLENEIKRLKENDIYEPLQRMALATHQHNLSKYQEIIGVSNENNIS